MSRERALVVGGEPTDLRLAAILLRREGFEVVAARDAAGALEAVRERAVRVALVDAACLEAARLLRAEVGARGVVIVALGSSGGDAERERAHEAGCDAWMPRPLDARAFDETLARLRAGAARV